MTGNNERSSNNGSNERSKQSNSNSIDQLHTPGTPGSRSPRASPGARNGSGGARVGVRVGCGCVSLLRGRRPIAIATPLGTAGPSRYSPSFSVLSACCSSMSCLSSPSFSDVKLWDRHCHRPRPCPRHCSLSCSVVSCSSASSAVKLCVRPCPCLCLPLSLSLVCVRFRSSFPSLGTQSLAASVLFLPLLLFSLPSVSVPAIKVSKRISI